VPEDSPVGPAQNTGRLQHFKINDVIGGWFDCAVYIYHSIDVFIADSVAEKRG
jgi:hypothetical protein